MPTRATPLGLFERGPIFQPYVEPVEKPRAVKRRLGCGYVHQREVAVESARGAFVAEQPSHGQLAPRVSYHKLYGAARRKAMPAGELLREYDGSRVGQQ